MVQTEGPLNSDLIKQLALEAGFSLAGFCDIELPELDRQRLRNWLDQQFHGSMSYMDKPGIDRCNAKTLAPYAQSVLMLALNYPAQTELPSDRNVGYISTYARSTDYHDVFKDKLKAFISTLNDLDPELEGRPFVDSAPLIERAFAVQAGLGWSGKNACLIHKGQGSYFFLGGLVLSRRFTSDSPVTDHCGSCQACIQACPTDAIVAPGQVDARRCISYLTIEKKGAWPLELRSAVGQHVFGCDICQIVCPWNQRFSESQQITEFENHGERINSGPLPELFASAMASFKKFARGTPVIRPGKKGMLRNIVTAMGNSENPEYLTHLEQVLDYPDDAVQNHARWAVEQIRNRTET